MLEARAPSHQQISEASSKQLREVMRDQKLDQDFVIFKLKDVLRWLCAKSPHFRQMFLDTARDSGR